MNYQRRIRKMYREILPQPEDFETEEEYEQALQDFHDYVNDATDRYIEEHR